MPSNTANGWPYVTPDDHPKEYPSTSQALAQLLEARPAARVITSTVPTFGAFGATNTLLAVVVANGAIPAGRLVRVTITGYGAVASAAANALYRLLNGGGGTLTLQHVVHPAQALNQTQALVFIFSMPASDVTLYGQSTAGTITPAHASSRITVEQLN